MKSGCPWEEIHGFANPSEYSRFRAWVEEQLVSGQAREQPVITPYGGIVIERWLRHTGSGQIWRLVAPDAPFYGLFAPVPVEEQFSLLSSFSIGSIP